MVLINVLTRTSNRPIYFRDCVDSVRSQTHRDLRHVVGADDDASLAYAQVHVPDALRLQPATPTDRRPNAAPYNLYLNTLMDRVEDGWIMFLDDDDTFVDAQSLAVIAEHATDEDRVLLWRVQFPGRLVPAHSFGRIPLLGDVTGAGFMFHSKHRAVAQWDAVKGADHRVIERLFLLLKPVWIDRILTRANYAPSTPDFRGGLGQRVDKPSAATDGCPAEPPPPVWPLSELETLRKRVAKLEAERGTGSTRA